MSRVLSCVIAEDERLFRDALTALLTSEWPKLQIVAACEDGGEALEALAENKPDVAFLDIRMPGLNGLDVAAACTELSPDTQVVFVTAYNQYAIDAFEKGAIDYLLKPVEPARLRATIARLQARVGSGERDTAALAALVKQLQQNLPARTAAGVDHRLHRQGFALDPGGRCAVFPVRQQIHHRGHRRG